MNQSDKDVGEQLVKYREANKLSQTDAAFQLGISTSYLSHLEKGTRTVNKKLLPRISSLYGISKSTLTDGATLADRKITCLHEVIARCNIKRALIVGDINKDEIDYTDSAREEDKKLGTDDDKFDEEDRELEIERDWTIGGGAWWASKAAIYNGLTPILYSTIGFDGDEVLHELEKLSLVEGKSGIVTCLVDKNPDLHTSKCNITMKKEKKITAHQYKDHCNDFELSRLAEAINVSGVGKNDIIFCHTFRLNREMLKFKADDETPEETKKIERREFVKEFMGAFMRKNGNDRPIVVLDFAPGTIYENLTLEECKIVIENSTVLVAELKSLLGWLSKYKPVNIPDNARKAIKDDFGLRGKVIEHDIETQPYFDTIIKYFLGPNEGNILIIRYGTGHMDYELILKRIEDGEYKVLRNLSDKKQGKYTKYSDKKENERLGSGDMRTFEFLKNEYFAKKTK